MNIYLKDHAKKLYIM